jgi:hypothetical protein
MFELRFKVLSRFRKYVSVLDGVLKRHTLEGLVLACFVPLSRPLLC